MSNSARAAFLAASSFLMLHLLAPAATGMRTAVVDGIEAESDNSTGTESIMPALRCHAADSPRTGPAAAGIRRRCPSTDGRDHLPGHQSPVLMPR